MILSFFRHSVIFVLSCRAAYFANKIFGVVHLITTQFQKNVVCLKDRLIQGSFYQTLPTSAVGYILLNPSMFTLYNASNDQCADSRFLDSETLSGFCECPVHTFWNGSLCLNQRFVNDSCANNRWCRDDLSLNCTSSKCVGKVDLVTINICIRE